MIELFGTKSKQRNRSCKVVDYNCFLAKCRGRNERTRKSYKERTKNVLQRRKQTSRCHFKGFSFFLLWFQQFLVVTVSLRSWNKPYRLCQRLVLSFSSPILDIVVDDGRGNDFLLTYSAPSKTRYLPGHGYMVSVYNELSFWQKAALKGYQACKEHGPIAASSPSAGRHRR